MYSSIILMKQEVAGAMLAATWGEITGSPGVCLSTRGPGATNMVNGIAHAFLDRAPLIAITDRYSSPEQEVGIRQRLDPPPRCPGEQKGKGHQWLVCCSFLVVGGSVSG